MSSSESQQPSAPSEFPQHHQIVVLTDGYSTPFVAKTAISLLRYRPSDIVAVLDQTATGQTSQQLLHAGGDIPVVGQLTDVVDADALYVGIAPPGGKLPEEWRPVICEALRRGMDVVSGLHDFLHHDGDYSQLASEYNCRLIDVRFNNHKSTAQGQPFRDGSVRIHSVGHDCSVGKMVTTLEVTRGLAEAGHDVKFLATGQTGIMISGAGVPIDCVVADFASEAMCLCVEYVQWGFV